jgi:hypothetical protein
MSEAEGPIGSNAQCRRELEKMSVRHCRSEAVSPLRACLDWRGTFCWTWRKSLKSFCRGPTDHRGLRSSEGVDALVDEEMLVGWGGGVKKPHLVFYVFNMGQ